MRVLQAREELKDGLLLVQVSMKMLVEGVC